MSHTENESSAGLTGPIAPVSAVKKANALKRERTRRAAPVIVRATKVPGIYEVILGPTDGRLERAWAKALKEMTPKRRRAHEHRIT